jgi:hypothetical protein
MKSYVDRAMAMGERLGLKRNEGNEHDEHNYQTTGSNAIKETLTLSGTLSGINHNLMG